MTECLDKIKSPQDLHLLSVEELGTLAEEVREYITESVSQTGGHLASNLGVVDLTIALHYVFDFKKDKLLWDVGHQCYAHKILTGRKDDFARLRQKDGLSGFPNPAESKYDLFSVGHAGSAIATAIGMTLGAQHDESDENIVAFVGDASIVNGPSFEALNNLSLVNRQMLIVLNDNSMAIDATPGSIARFLSKVRLTHTYEDIRRTTNNILEHLPVIGKRMEGAIKNLTRTLRMAVSPSRLFESMNIPYFGPVDGHDIGSLIKVFRAVAQLDRPAILHVYTRKGYGFSPADEDPRKYHSTGPFKLNGDKQEVSEKRRTFTDAFSDAVVELAGADDRIIAITAAMTDGTGLGRFRDKFAERYYDVGIAESAAVDIAAGLAKQGKRPLVCIYSTFLQRSFDQIFQEISLQDLPVIFCIDRSGLVGNDGPTHHGLLDVGFLRMFPNMTLISPANESEMRSVLSFAVDLGGPVAIRYPRSALPNDGNDLAACSEPFESGKSVTVRQADGEVVIVALGGVLTEAVKAAELLAGDGIEATVINARFAKPIDEKIVRLICEGKNAVIVEDHALAGGFGSAVLELVAKRSSGADSRASRKRPGKVVCLGVPDEFIKAATRNVQFEEVGITAVHIAKAVREIMNQGS